MSGDPGNDDAVHERHMRRALALAEGAKDKPGTSPIGCVIVLDGRVVAEAHNEVGMRHDPTAHAEIVAIRRACAALGRDDLRGATLYSTLQPCGMCTMASIWSSITTLVFGAERADVHRMYFEDRRIGTGDIVADAFRDDVFLRRGILRGSCAALLHGPDDEPPEAEQANV